MDPRIRALVIGTAAWESAKREFVPMEPDAIKIDIDITADAAIYEPVRAKLPPLDSPGQGSVPEPLNPPIGREPDPPKEERFMRMYAPPHLALESMTIRCIDGNTEPGRHRTNRQKKAARKRQKEARRRNR